MNDPLVYRPAAVVRCVVNEIGAVLRVTTDHGREGVAQVASAFKVGERIGYHVA